MQGLTQPTLLLKRFCESGTKNTLPVTNTDTSNPQLADLTNGFPIATQGSPDDGKLPPERADFNALGYLTTSYDYFYQAGGTFTFDSTIASAIGGYPLGARLWYTNSSGISMILRSTKDDNTDDFTSDESYIGSSWVIESMVGYDNSSINILDFKFSDKIINKQSWILSNGSWYSGATYFNAIDYLKKEVAFVPTTSSGQIRIDYPVSGLEAGTYSKDSTKDIIYDGVTYYGYSLSTNTFYLTLDTTGMSGADAYSALQGQRVYLYVDSEMKQSIHKLVKITQVLFDTNKAYYISTGSSGTNILDVSSGSYQEEGYEFVYNDTGIAWFYLLDRTNNRFKLPRSKWNFVGTRSGSAGSYIQEALPNHEHPMFTSTTSSAAATSVSDRIARASAGGLGNGDYLLCATNDYPAVGSTAGANAPAYYEGGDVVQQRATEMYLYFYVGTFNDTATEQTAGINASTINNKADIDLGNIAPLQSVKSEIIAWGIPDYTTTIASLSATMPYNAFCYFRNNATLNGADAIVTIYNSTNTAVAGYRIVWGSSLELYLEKGFKYEITGGVSPEGYYYKLNGEA